MKWVPDRSGRLPRRPHFNPQELDFECESIVARFLAGKHGQVNFPLSTDDLLVLLEAETSDLDVYADLAAEGEDVEGFTEFVAGKKPTVKVSHTLSEDPRRENRYRTTLAHEFGHAKFHMPLFAVISKQARLIPDSASAMSPRCKRASILNAASSDWMEWQAGYISGAVLMPVLPLKKMAAELAKTASVYWPQDPGSSAAQILIHNVQAVFQVSAGAATVRLSQLKYLANTPTLHALLETV